MPTDTERREAARRLRELDREENYTPNDFIWAIIATCNEHISVPAYLADLIEPSCDRDALLRLARYMDKDVAETEAHFSNVISTKSVSDYARRIREACGEVGR